MNEGRNEEAGSGIGTLSQPAKGYWVRNISHAAAELGFPAPLLATAAVWDACVAVPDDCPPHDVEERISAIVEALDDACGDYLCACAIPFSVTVEDDDGHVRTVELKAVGRPTADGNLVFIVMLAEEE